MAGKIRNQLNARKTVQEALNDCGDNEDLRVAVRKCVECEEYKAGKAVPAEVSASSFSTDLPFRMIPLVAVKPAMRSCRYPLTFTLPLPIVR